MSIKSSRLKTKDYQKPPAGIMFWVCREPTPKLKVKSRTWLNREIQRKPTVILA